MNPATWAIAVAVGLFLGVLACLELGYRLARRQTEQPELAQEGIGAIEAAVFALLGLLLGFSFAGGTTRLDSRRQLIVQEANAIGTAYLRLDLLGAADQPDMRGLFREYLEKRLRVYQVLPDLRATERELADAAGIQQRIWSRAIVASRADPTHISSKLLLPALNEMFDVTSARTVALYTHLPALIFGLLISVALLSGLLAGYAMAKRRSRSWIHMLAYALVVAMTIYA
ncbi:MAG: DUF4239 domain-containing protein, partial [Bryobacteraceae bacterium]|nr:DUF4239 domain-containing protein [Bryobacteraceae bacterium]